MNATIKFVTWDDQNSTFNSYFDAFPKAKKDWDTRLDPKEPCESGLKVIAVDASGEIIAESDIFYEKHYWLDGKLACKIIR